MTQKEVVLGSVLLVILLCLITVSYGKPETADADTRCELTLDGLLNYYWKSDPKHKKIQFLFACGQIGALGGSYLPGQCSCSSVTTCVNCYRWWTAVAMESLATYGIYKNTTNHSNIPTIIYQHSPYNSEWNATAICTFVDDFIWYAIAYLRVYDWLSDPKWLNYSISLYDWAWENGWDDECGGFVWSTCPNQNFKFNIEFLEGMHLASKLAYILPNETRFLEDAEYLWNWFFRYDNGYGLMTEEYLVSTGAIPIGCCNATSNNNRCVNSQSHDTIYSQGLLLSSSAYLYLCTGNKTYLNTGIRAFEAVLANYTVNGILRDEPRGFPTAYSTYCSNVADPGGDWYSFNGVFMLHLGYFTELLVKNGSMPDDTLKQINTFVQKMSDSAWSKSAVWPPFNQTNVCAPGSNPIINKNASHPKFHWWWAQNVQYDFSMTADPGYYYHKTQLRCYTLNGQDTQIWEGQLASEDKCMEKCDMYEDCSKYLWQTYEDVIAGTNCWIWTFNRSNHMCNLTDADWNVGIKRPKGHASCAGKCGSTEPQKLDHGVCYCDADCAAHLDCCSDYANYCRKNQPPTCKGKCNNYNTVEPQPVPGGGYCWCSAGCNPGFTGGGCCADYWHYCEGGSLQPCMDGRTQGSALNLFLSHAIVSRVTKKS